jgi:mannosyltransferase OCH1-like enzyme
MKYIYVLLFCSIFSQHIDSQEDLYTRSIELSKIKTHDLEIKNDTDQTILFTAQSIDPKTNQAKSKEYKVLPEQTTTYIPADKSHYISRLYIPHSFGMHFHKKTNGRYSCSISEQAKTGLSYSPPILKDFDIEMGNNKASARIDQRFFNRATKNAPENKFAQHVINPIKPLDFFDLVKYLYAENSPHNESNYQSENNKIIHHIWVGSALPKPYEAWRDTWQEKHPLWTHILWTDHDANFQYGNVITTEEELRNELADEQPKKLVVDITLFPLLKKDLIETATNYGEKSDILRYEILFKFGGVYADTDLECLESLDQLHDQYDFYTGLAPIRLWRIQAANGIIGSKPGHPIIEYCLDNVVNREVYKKLDKCPGLYDGISIIAATGPGLFTKAIYYGADQNNHRDVVLPPSYFYSLRETHLKYKPKPTPFLHLPQAFEAPLHAYTIHYWEMSWKERRKAK